MTPAALFLGGRLDDGSQVFEGAGEGEEEKTASVT
jgi:hypothetical protein